MKNKKYKRTRIINIVINSLLAICLMVAAHSAWSQYGEYGWYQFFASLVYHGGFGVIIYILVDCVLHIVYNQNEER